MQTTATIETDNAADWRLARDIRAACQSLGREEARFLVKSYYALQDDRIRERAIRTESASRSERAKGSESTIPRERATEDESTRSSERTTGDATHELLA